jgi:transposase
MRKYRQYTIEFKKQLVAQIESKQVSLSQAARENNISPTLIDRWRKQLQEGTLSDQPTTRERQLERELDRYKKKVGELTIEVELLKKLKNHFLHPKKSSGSIITVKDWDRSSGGVK